MDKIEQTILRKFLDYVCVTTHWFINRIERKHPDETLDPKFQELKNLLKHLEEERNDLEHE